MRCLALLVLIAGCADPGLDCPLELAGGTFPTGAPGAGVFVTEIEQDGTHLRAGYVQGGPPDPALPGDVRAFIAPDRWLRMRVAAIGGTFVQECRHGGTATWDCDDLGPPSHGRLVAYHDGVQIADMLLYTPAFPITAPAGCPVLSGGHVDPPR